MVQWIRNSKFDENYKPKHQETLQTNSTRNKKTTLKHIIIKLLKNINKEKNLKKQLEEKKHMFRGTRYGRCQISSQKQYK